MSHAGRRGTVLRWWLVALLAASPARADDAADADKEQMKRWDRQFRESLGWYVVSARPSGTAPLKPQGVLRWTNPVRKQRGEPTLVFWTGSGRPEALASVYPWGETLMYECVSLARDNGLTLRENGRTVWAPAAPGVSFREVADAPQAVETASGRLVQARSIAERFKAFIKSGEGQNGPGEFLRLLPKPIYRYPVEQVKAVDANLVDGAVFAFVQGTDPEVVLIIEAVRRGDRTAWQYAFARATGYLVEARLGTQVVWTGSAVRWHDPTGPAIALGRPLAQ